MEKTKEPVKVTTIDKLADNIANKVYRQNEDLKIVPYPGILPLPTYSSDIDKYIILLKEWKEANQKYNEFLKEQNEHVLEANKQFVSDCVSVLMEKLGIIETKAYSVFCYLVKYLKVTENIEYYPSVLACLKDFLEVVKLAGLLKIETKAKSK